MWGVVFVDPQLPCFLCLAHWPCREAVCTFGISAGQKIHTVWHCKSFIQPPVSLNRCWISLRSTILAMHGNATCPSHLLNLMPWCHGQRFRQDVKQDGRTLQIVLHEGKEERIMYSRARCSLQGRVPTEPTDSASFRVHQIYINVLTNAATHCPYSVEHKDPIARNYCARQRSRAWTVGVTKSGCWCQDEKYVFVILDDCQENSIQYTLYYMLVVVSE